MISFYPASNIDLPLQMSLPDPLHITPVTQAKRFAPRFCPMWDMAHNSCYEIPLPAILFIVCFSWFDRGTRQRAEKRQDLHWHVHCQFVGEIGSWDRGVWEGSSYSTCEANERGQCAVPCRGGDVWFWQTCTFNSFIHVGSDIVGNLQIVHEGIQFLPRIALWNIMASYLLLLCFVQLKANKKAREVLKLAALHSHAQNRPGKD